MNCSLQPGLLENFAVSFYCLWHGKLRLPGAGFTIRVLASHFSVFQRLPLQIDGLDLILDPRDVSCFYWLNEKCGDGFEEAGLVNAFRKLINQESVIWDIGANCGLFSHKASAGKTYSAWHAFEPNPSVATIAESAFSSSKIHLYRFALSDVCEEKMLTVVDGASLKGTLSPEVTHRSGRSLIVNCLTGDSLVYEQKMPPPSLVKIDAEGHEKQVLQGMTQVIAEHQPTIFLEHISYTDQEIADMIPPGYCIMTVEEENGALVDFLRSRGHNSALIPIDKMKF